MIYLINLPLATETWDENEYKAIQKVITSNRFTMGPEVESFEQEFAKYFGSKYAIMVNSGSSANLLSVAALFYSSKYKLEKGDEVIVPAVSWATTYTPLQQYGLKLRFVDIDIDTLNLDLKILEDSITPNTKAIFAVNLLGNPLNYEKLLDITKKYNLILIEDNCESMGAIFQGKYTGTFGLMGTFSTFFSHHISTMEGGVILTEDDELRDILLSLRSHGWTRNLSKNSSIYHKQNDDFYETFNFILPGYNIRPLEIQGAIGREQIKKLPSLLKERRKNGNYFYELFSKLKSIKIQKAIEESSYFGFSILINSNAPYTRLEAVKLLRKNGVECRPIVAGNFTKNKVIDFFDHTIYGELNNANIVHYNGFFIGNHHFDCSQQLEKVYELLKMLERGITEE